VAATTSRALEDRLERVEGITHGLMAWVRWYESVNGVIQARDEQDTPNTGGDEDKQDGNSFRLAGEVVIDMLSAHHCNPNLG
jgi:hypothetical protein